MRHRIVTSIAPTLFASVCLLGYPALGQSPEAPGEPAVAETNEGHEAVQLTEELAKLNATLVEIKSLLERVTETQGLDLLMKRMELSAAQAGDLEIRLDPVESERTSIADEMRQIESNLEAYIAGVEEGDNENSAQLEAFTAQAAGEIARREERLLTLDNEIAALRNRLETKRRELEDWQGYVDRRLGGV